MVELGESNTAIVPVVEKRSTEKFSQTKAEWAVINRQQVGAAAEGISGTSTLVTIPDGMDFMLTGFTLSCFGVATGINTGIRIVAIGAG